MGKTKNIVIAAGILIVLFLAGFFIYRDFKSSKENKDNEITSEEQNTSISNILEEENTENNSLEVNQKKEDEPAAADIKKIAISDLSKKTVIKVDLPEDMEKNTLEQITALTNSLKKNYDSWGEWIQLGLLKKLLGDYQGAREAWEFAAIIRPKDSISRHNLGNLYWQNLKDLKKAEENYLKAIELSKQDISAYVDLSNIYYYDLKDKIKAETILNKGLVNNSGNEELKRAMKDMNLNN